MNAKKERQEDNMRKGLIEGVKKVINEEYEAANKKFKMFYGAHEGYAVILEEAQETEEEMRNMAACLNEIWSATRANVDKDMLVEMAGNLKEKATLLAAEAIQTATMAEKYIQSMQKIQREAEQEAGMPAGLKTAAAAVQEGYDAGITNVNNSTVEQIIQNIKKASGASMFRNA